LDLTVQCPVVACDLDQLVQPSRDTRGVELLLTQRAVELLLFLRAIERARTRSARWRGVFPG
jgi:hypothetical protein